MPPEVAGALEISLLSQVLTGPVAHERQGCEALINDERETMAALGAAGFDDLAATTGAGTGTESAFADAFDFMWSVGRSHGNSRFAMKNG